MHNEIDRLRSDLEIERRRVCTKDGRILGLEEMTAKYRRLSAEKDNILRSVNEEKDSEIRHLRGMLRQAAEECTGCASLRGELAHCESALIDCQENAAQPSVEDYNEEVTRTNAANMVAANKYNAMVDKNNSGQGKKLEEIAAMLVDIDAKLKGKPPSAAWCRRVYKSISDRKIISEKFTSIIQKKWKLK